MDDRPIDAPRGHLHLVDHGDPAVEVPERLAVTIMKSPEPLPPWS